MTIADSPRAGDALVADVAAITERVGELLPRLRRWAGLHQRSWDALSDPLNEEQDLIERSRLVEIDDELLALEDVLGECLAALAVTEVVRSHRITRMAGDVGEREPVTEENDDDGTVTCPFCGGETEPWR
jgi:hypothetical protein